MPRRRVPLRPVDRQPRRRLRKEFAPRRLRRARLVVQARDARQGHGALPADTQADLPLQLALLPHPLSRRRRQGLPLDEDLRRAGHRPPPGRPRPGRRHGGRTLRRGPRKARARPRGGGRLDGRRPGRHHGLRARLRREARGGRDRDRRDARARRNREGGPFGRCRKPPRLLPRRGPLRRQDGGRVLRRDSRRGQGARRQARAVRRHGPAHGAGVRDGREARLLREPHVHRLGRARPAARAVPLRRPRLPHGPHGEARRAAVADAHRRARVGAAARRPLARLRAVSLRRGRLAREHPRDLAEVRQARLRHRVARATRARTPSPTTSASARSAPRSCAR